MNAPETDRLAGHVQRPPERLGLASLPTPVEPLPTPGRDDIWVKCDHLSSPVYGGGKVRKLEYIFGDLHARGIERVLSIGAFGSHHLLALALHGRELGLGVDAIVAPQVVTSASVRNLAATVSAGTRMVPVADRLLVPLGIARARLLSPRAEYFLPPGGSDASGCLGFVEAGLEFCAQVRDGICPSPAHVYVTAGTAGTAAGLVVGFELGGLSTHVRLVSAVESMYFNRWLFRQKLRLVRRALERHGLSTSASPGVVTWSIDHGEVGGGYAVPTERGRHALEWAASQKLHLETTYTGKCVSAMLRDVHAGRAEGPCLYWHTHASTDVGPHVDEGWFGRLPKMIQRWIGDAYADVGA